MGELVFMNALEVKKRILSQHTVFANLSGEDLEEIAALAVTDTYDQGSTIFATGDPPASMFLIAEGEVSVVKTGEYISDTEIARLVAGDSLGEIDMISDTPRTVSAKAATALTVVRFPPRDISFRAWLEKAPGPGSHILFSFIADIAERTRRANTLLKENSPQIQELRRQIYEDKLTGLQNKVSLEEQFPGIIASSKDAPTSLLMFKPDNFKQINDQAGHEAGDGLLVHLAHLFPAILPAGALLIRYAGNEFGIILKNADRAAATLMAEKIVKFYNDLDVSAFLPVEGFHLTVSVGIAVYPEHGTTAAEIIEKAHALPLLGRAAGGNKILFPEDAAGRTP
jgi:diguanylate cyclase